MGEMVLVNLIFFLIPSPARVTPFPPVNKFPNNEAPKVPNNILRNLPLCSLASCWIVSLTPFNNKPEFSRDLTIFIISFISSFEIIKVVVPAPLVTPEPSIFFLILPSIADIAAVNPNGANTFLANYIATFINGPANLLNKFPKNPPDCDIFNN